MAISPRLPRRKLYTFFEINFFFIGKGHFAFFERYVRGNIHCSFYAHWKARSGLPISDNWTFFRQMLMDCPELRDVRLKYFTASSLKDIFESVDNQIIIDFIKDAHFYHQFWISIRSRRFWRDTFYPHFIVAIKPYLSLTFSTDCADVSLRNYSLTRQITADALRANID